jgi:uncharacterized protein (TIGR00369 family)
VSPLADHIARVPYYRYLGLREGPAGALVLPGEPRHVGDHERDLLHGGILSAFLEAAGLLYLRTSGAAGAETLTLTTDYLRPAPVADAMATVTTVRRGRRIAHLRIEAWQTDPSLPVAVAHGGWLLLASTWTAPAST